MLVFFMRSGPMHPNLACLPYRFPAALPAAFKAYRGILLDVDGTLADSNLLHARTWQQGFMQAGYPVTLADVYARIGKGADWLLPELTGIKDHSAEGQALIQQQSEAFLKDLPTVQAIAGAREWIEQLKKQGYLVALASSGSPEHVAATLRQIGLADLLQPLPARLLPEDSKPAPDVIEQAAQSIGLAPADCVMVGDTIYDAQAAKKAGSAFWPVLTNPVWAAQLCTTV